MKRLFVAFLLSGLSISAFASAEAENVLVVKPDPASVMEGSSSHMRIGKQYTFTAETGLAVGVIPSAGLTAGTFLDRNTILQVSGTKGTLPFLWHDINAKTFTANYKKFFGNSFYLRGGPGYREIQVVYKGIFAPANQEIGMSKSIVADVAIGNQWQWDIFTIGCDWIGAMIPVSTISSHYDSSGLSGSDKQDTDEKWDRIAKTTSSQSLRFYIGASF